MIKILVFKHKSINYQNLEELKISMLRNCEGIQQSMFVI
jgi:hypothetical protein